MSTKTTYKQTELGLIPEDWELKKLGKVGEIDKKSLNSNTDKEYEFDYISLSDVDSDQFSIKTSKQKFKNAPSRARRIVKKGDVLLSTVRPNLEGFTIIRDEVKDLIASTGFAVITSKNELHNEYLFNFLFSNIIKRQFHKLLVGSNYPAINSSDVKNLKIPLPPLQEQKKIADCLSTWDSAIEKQNALINALTDRKKALMQQLLTGKKRLPGFSGEWKEVSLIELADFRRGSFPQPYGLPEWYDNENGEPFIQVYDVGDNFNLKPTTKSKISELAQVQSVFIKKGTLIVTLQGSIGKVAITNYDAYIDRTLLLFSSFKMKVDIYFIMYQIHNLFNIEKEKAPGGIIKTITKEVLSNFKIKLPSFEEQTAIAEILATADRELQLQKEKLAQLQTQKKGLMQVLLTGKKRLIN